MKPKITMPKPMMIALIAAELASAVAAWRDLAHRTDDQVRGPRTGWRLFITLNPGNSLAYWTIGRRQATSLRAPKAEPSSANKQLAGLISAAAWRTVP